MPKKLAREDPKTVEEPPIALELKAAASIGLYFSRVTVTWSRAEPRAHPHLIWFTFEGPDEAYARLRLDREDRKPVWSDPRVMAKTRGLPEAALHQARLAVTENKQLVCDTLDREQSVTLFCH